MRVRTGLGLLAAAARVLPYLDELLANLDPPRSLQELQDAVRSPRPGTDVHHIVETQYGSSDPQANARRFEGQLESPENQVRIPRRKHYQINAWFGRSNDNYGGLTPRQYLRGKSWEEQYEVGQSALRRFGVLK